MLSFSLYICKSSSQIYFTNKFNDVTLISRVDLNSYSFPLASEDQFATTKILPSIETSPQLLSSEDIGPHS